MVTAVVIGIAVGALLWVAYRRPRARRWKLPRPAATRPAAAVESAAVGAAVDRQHRHLQAGGLIGETTVESAKARLAEMLAAGRTTEVDEQLRPGLEFAVQVKALAEIGTREAGEVLERQLTRTLTLDPVEQAWYWVDVVIGLRQMNRTGALPAVLTCAEVAATLHQGTVLSAEAVAFPNFPATLHDLTSPHGRLAALALARAARGCRDQAIDISGMLRAGIGDHLAAVSETAPPVADPWVTGAMLEAERVSRRFNLWATHLSPDLRSLAERQAARLAASAERRAEWLFGAAPRLLARFPSAPVEEQTASLRCLDDLRADSSDLFPGLPDRNAPWWPEAIRALTWARARSIGPLLAGQAAALYGSRRAGPAVLVVLGALRGHRCHEGEQVLVRAAGAPDSDVRRAAFRSLGWWDPFDPAAVVEVLRTGRGDKNPGVRRAAVAALARLGERAAVLELTEALGSEEPSIRQFAALEAAEEGVTWLWPELESLSDAPDTAFAAAEALERLREQFLGPLG